MVISWQCLSISAPSGRLDERSSVLLLGSQIQIILIHIGTQTLVPHLLAPDLFELLVPDLALLGSTLPPPLSQGTVVHDNVVVDLFVELVGVDRG